MPTNMIRLDEDDTRKSGTQIKHQLEHKLTCKLEWCNSPLSTKTGPGANHLCRPHQLQQREYGGLGRYDRPWTFSREWSCAWCGYSPKDDEWFDNPPVPFDSDVHKHQVMRSTLIADHLTRKVDGGTHDKTNIQTLCQTCNSKKTALFKDFVKTSTEIIPQ